MPENRLILLIQEHSSPEHVVQRALDGQPSFRLQRVERFSMALARMAGGGVDVVLLDLTAWHDTAAQAVDRFRALQASAPNIPKVVLCNLNQESLGRSIVSEGAAGCVVAERCQTDLIPTIQVALGGSGDSAKSRRAAIFGFLGVKGGVGATSLALNVAATLAKESHVALVELQPPVGNLSFYFRQPAIRNLSSLSGAGRDSLRPPDIESCLWPCRGIPNLSILFSPQQLHGSSEIVPGDAQAILLALAQLVDFVILDLGSSLSPAIRAVMPHCDRLALVLERDPVCLPLGRLMLEQIEAPSEAPRLIAPVVVNRTPLSAPFSLADIERELGAPPLGVIAPAPDLFLAAQRARQPVATFQPESIAAGAFLELARNLKDGHLPQALG